MSSASPPRRLLRVGLPVAAGVLLATGSAVAADRVRDRARGIHSSQWIDDAVGADADVHYLNTAAYQSESATGTPYDRWLAYWETEFRNRSLRDTIGLGSREPAPIAQRDGSVVWTTGDVEAGRAPAYVLTDRRFRVQGEEVARREGFVLTRVRPPLRLATVEENVGRNGEANLGASYDVYDPDVSAVEVTVTAPEPTQVEIVAAHLAPAGNTPQLGAMTALTRGTAAPGRPARLRIQLLEAPARVDVRMSRGPTRVHFEPIPR